MFSISSSSSSSASESDMNTEFDELVEEFIFNHYSHSLIPQQTQQHENDREYVPINKGDRDRERGHNQLFNDYFAENSVYNDNQFRRRFRMRRPLFCRIMEKVVDGDQFFQQRRNAAGRLGLSPLQKCTAAIRMLAYGLAPDAVDEYLRMGQTISRKALQHFCQGVIAQFEGQYLRRSKNATLILEAVADQDLWIWHAFFGMPGSCNDLNVLYRSTVFDEVLQGRAPPIHFTVNGHEYNLGYYLADGIYPKWPTFIQGITHPQVQKDRLFADKQAAARKDVERAFGVLQARFAIIREPSLAFDEDNLCDIMKACIIMHNMIVEDERHTYTRAEVLQRYYEEDQPQRTGTTSEASTSAMVNNNEQFEFNNGRPPNVDFNTYVQRRTNLRDRETHLSLKRDLVEHIWQNFRQIEE